MVEQDGTGRWTAYEKRLRHKYSVLIQAEAFETMGVSVHFPVNSMVSADCRQV